MRLGVVDQSPIPAGSTAADALANTLDLAKRCDELGYHRYWLAEHHNSDGLAGSAPEVLVGSVAAATRDIRVGTGGVMLSHYSALKVAENFRVLEALHPGRIDLGVGRAPGSDLATAAALAPTGRRLPLEYFPNQLQELIQLVRGEATTSKALEGVRARPATAGSPELWLLASSAEGAGLAAHFGLPLAWARFITVEDGEAVVGAYRDYFRPSSSASEPRAVVAVSVICADDDAAADRIASSVHEWRRNALRGPIPRIEDAERATRGTVRKVPVLAGRKPMVVGGPDRVGRELRSIAAAHGAQEVLVVTICHRHEDRLRSYELVAECLA